MAKTRRTLHRDSTGVMPLAASRTPVDGQALLRQMPRLWAVRGPEDLEPLVERFRNMDLMSRLTAVDSREADDGPQYETIDGVAVVQVCDLLMKSAPWYYSLFGLQVRTLPQMAGDIAAAAADPAVKAIMVYVDSPGGEAIPTAEVADALWAARSVKPTAAYIHDLGASAAYHIASQAERLTGNRAAWVGSIGTYLTVYDLSAQAEEIGLKVHVVKAGQFKGAGEPGTTVTDEQLANWQREVNEVNEVFLDAVMRGRRWEKEKALAMCDGRMHSGLHAIEQGLVDGRESFEDAMAALRKAAERRAAGGRPVAAVAASASQDRPSVTMMELGAHVTSGNPERTSVMNKPLREYLTSVGLKAGATDQEAIAFWHSLTGDQRAQADRIALGQEAASGGAGQTATPPAPTSIQTPPPVDADRVRRDAVDAERRRVAHIQGLAAVHGCLGPAWATQHVAAGTTADEANRLALVAIGAANAPVPVGAPRVTADNNLDTLGPAVVDAVLLRAGNRLLETDSGGQVILGADGRPTVRKAHDRARQFRGLRLSELARAYLTAVGINTEGMSATQVARLVFDWRGQMRLGASVHSHSTSDFPYLLESAVNKVLQSAFLEAQVTYPRWTARRTAPDFKSIRLIQAGAFGDLAVVEEGAEYTEATFGESRETCVLVKRGKTFYITWETLINDDLSVFNRIPEMFGNSAQRTREGVVLAVLTANAALSDTVALFHATHANLASGQGNVGAPSTALLNKGRAAMRKQTGIAPSKDETGPVLDIQPRFLIAPAALEGTVLQLLASMADPSSSNANAANIWRGVLEPIITGRLDANSATAWYLASNPAEHPTICHILLEGEEAPVLVQEDGFEVDGRKYKLRDTFAAAAEDYRGLYKNPGA